MPGTPANEMLSFGSSSSVDRLPNSGSAFCPESGKFFEFWQGGPGDSCGEIIADLSMPSAAQTKDVMHNDDTALDGCEVMRHGDITFGALAKVHELTRQWRLVRLRRQLSVRACWTAWGVH